jgi:hypothetical protein
MVDGRWWMVDDRWLDTGDRRRHWHMTDDRQIGTWQMTGDRPVTGDRLPVTLTDDRQIGSWQMTDDRWLHLPANWHMTDDRWRHLAAKRASSRVCGKPVLCVKTTHKTGFEWFQLSSIISTCIRRPPIIHWPTVCLKIIECPKGLPLPLERSITK